MCSFGVFAPWLPSYSEIGTWAFQQPAHRGLPGLLREQREERTDRVLIAQPRHESFGRAVHDLPVAQVAPAAERHGARADAANRQGDAVQVGSRRRPAATATRGRRAHAVGAARCAASASAATAAERGQPAQSKADRLHEVAPVHLRTAVVTVTTPGLGLGGIVGHSASHDTPGYTFDTNSRCRRRLRLRPLHQATRPRFACSARSASATCSTTWCSRCCRRSIRSSRPRCGWTSGTSD